MKTISNFGASFILGAGLICIIGIAGAVAQRQPRLTAATAKDAYELSSVFRRVSRDALPGIVTIESRKNDDGGRLRNLRGRMGRLPLENNPQLREFFRQLEGEEQGAPDGQDRLGEGSGFIIDRAGYIMTNNHVVADADEVIVTLHDGRQYKATKDAIATDERSDVAVIRIENPPANLKALRFGDSDQMQIGDWVLAIGAPFGYELTVTQGIISAKGRGVPGLPKEFLQTDAAVNPGNSGGPLLNLAGEVIGINTAISTRSGGYDGISFAVPSKTARWASEQLVRNGTVKRAGLGVHIGDVTFEMAKELKLESPYGVVVKSVYPGTPAGKANIQVEDVIVAIDGNRIRGSNQLQATVEQLAFGETYKLTVYRDGKRMTVPVLMTEIDFDEIGKVELQRQQTDADKPLTADEIGVVIREMDAATTRRLGLEPRVGVVVTAVKRGSAGHAVGVRPGHVIRKIDSVEVNSVEDYQRAMKNVSFADGVLLLVENETGSQLLRIQRN